MELYTMEALRNPIYGKPGQPIRALVYEDGNPDGSLTTAADSLDEPDHDMLLLSDDSLHRFLEFDERFKDSSHWHGVSNDLVQAMTTSDFVTQPTQAELERQDLWDECVRSVQLIADSTWVTGDKIIVSAANSLADSTLPYKHPSSAARTATRGLFFCSTLDNTTHPADEHWDIIQVPLRSTQGRLLAMLRMVPLVAGRADVTLAILNGDSRRPDNCIFEDMEQLEGISYGTHKSGWNAANLGRFWGYGCVFHHCCDELRHAFAKYGHVYGTDEVWLLEHDPVAVVAQSSMTARRAVCWKPKTMVKNMTWIIWKAEPLEFREIKMTETTVKDLCKLERVVFQGINTDNQDDTN